MAITNQHIKEQLSLAYLYAVVGKAGFTISQFNLDYGVDATINYVRQLPNGKFKPTGIGLHCQLKATQKSSLEEDWVVYDMDVAAYNKLTEWEGPPCILVVMRLPENYDEWLNLTEDQLLLKNCCYWTQITDTSTDKSSKIRIRISRTQIFTPEVVSSLLEQVREIEMPSIKLLQV